MPDPTPDLISGWAAVCISLALSYIPGLRDRWDALTGDQRRAITGLLLVACAAAGLAYACAGETECLARSWEPWARALLAALVGSQATYVLTGGRRRHAT